MVQRAESIATSLQPEFHPRDPHDRKELTLTSFSDLHTHTHIPPHINQAINSRLLKKKKPPTMFSFLIFKTFL